MARRSFLPRALLRFFYRENLHRVFLVIIALVIVSAVSLWRLEPGRPLVDWLWWSVVTITTVGYGDLTPETLQGRMIGIFLMFSGIGVLSMFTATIAGFFVELKLKINRGMKSLHFKNHYIICEWSSRSRAIYEELRSDPRNDEVPIVLLADNVQEKPVDDEDFYFIHGDVSEENLHRAAVETAATVVVTGDDRLDPAARDAKVVLTTLTVEHLNPDAYTVVELVREENARHCERAHADEIIIGDEFCSRLLASAAVDHGVSKVVSELLSTRFGNDLRKVSLPERFYGQSFLNVMSGLKETNSSTAVAVMRGKDVITNPAAEFALQAGDHLIVIADRNDR